jgi:hypothetical protein
LSPGISHLTYRAAYAPFTPSDSEQRSGPSYYRGCWHEVSRPFLFWYYQSCLLLTTMPYSQMTGVYNPKTVILHAALHHQGCPHCELFSTAATRRCLDRVSVPVCLIVLSDQVPVVALVGRYPANKLIGREPILQRQPLLATFNLAIPWGINPSFPGLFPTEGHVIHVLLTRAPLNKSCITTQLVPCDLHVLNTPPAFVLSQNQTLRKN